MTRGWRVGGICFRSLFSFRFILMLVCGIGEYVHQNMFRQKDIFEAPRIYCADSIDL